MGKTAHRDRVLGQVIGYQGNAPRYTDAFLLRRVQDANLREVRRPTNLLLNIQRRKRRAQLPQTSEVCHDVLEKEGT
ncbi:MAG: hypothetical protein ABSF71_01505 [Terriglobia bacterium]